MALEIVFEGLAVAHQEGDAVVSAWQDEGLRAGLDPGQAVAAQAVAEHDRVERAVVRLINLFLDAGSHGPGALVVQALGEEQEVDLMAGANHGVAKLSQDDFTADQQQVHEEALTFSSTPES